MSPLEGQRADEIAAMLAVAREGSVVPAGRTHQRHATAISKRIAALEQRLGIRLPPSALVRDRATACSIPTARSSR